MPIALYTSFIAEEFREEGREQGRTEGRAEGRARDILLVLETRGIAVSDDVRERIGSCRDSVLMKSWFEHAVTADSAEKIFETT
ncbi:hypothetical protein ABZ353_08305 [Streptomyces niveus]|uniref:hypothetical protein n=1 Tax=Streptomyces niveus TaxID=193462 RepID=UPI0033CB0B77